MNNLLSKNILASLPGNAWLYVVNQGGDFRIQASQLAGLVSKTSLGLDRVDNTRDLEKPISTQTQTALQALSQAINVCNQAIQNLSAADVDGLAEFIDQHLFPTPQW